VVGRVGPGIGAGSAVAGGQGIQPDLGATASVAFDLRDLHRGAGGSDADGVDVAIRGNDGDRGIERRHQPGAGPGNREVGAGVLSGFCGEGF